MNADDEINIDTSKMLVFGTPVPSVGGSSASVSTDAAS